MTFLFCRTFANIKFINNSFFVDSYALIKTLFVPGNKEICIKVLAQRNRSLSLACDEDGPQNITSPMVNSSAAPLQIFL
jgi:hypothetical protein